MTAVRPAQLTMTMPDPAIPPMDGYIAVMLAARQIKDREALQVFLDRALAAGRICQTDARCIWRGAMWVWKTPFG